MFDRPRADFPRLVSIFVTAAVILGVVYMIVNYAVTSAYSVKEDLLVGDSRLKKVISHSEGLEYLSVHGADEIIHLLGGTVVPGNPVLVRLNGKTIAVGPGARASKADAFVWRDQSGLGGTWKAGDFLALVRAGYPQARLERVYDAARPERDRWLFFLVLDDREPPMTALPRLIQSRGGTILCKIGPEKPFMIDEGHPVTEVFWKDKNDQVNSTQLTEFPWGPAWAWSYGKTTDSPGMKLCGPANGG